MAKNIEQIRDLFDFTPLALGVSQSPSENMSGAMRSRNLASRGLWDQAWEAAQQDVGFIEGTTRKDWACWEVERNLSSDHVEFATLPALIVRVEFAIESGKLDGWEDFESLEDLYYHFGPLNESLATDDFTLGDAERILQCAIKSNGLSLPLQMAAIDSASLLAQPEIPEQFHQRLHAHYGCDGGKQNLHLLLDGEAQVFATHDIQMTAGMWDMLDEHSDMSSFLKSLSNPLLASGDLQYVYEGTPVHSQQLVEACVGDILVPESSEIPLSNLDFAFGREAGRALDTFNSDGDTTALIASLQEHSRIVRPDADTTAPVVVSHESRSEREFQIDAFQRMLASAQQEGDVAGTCSYLVSQMEVDDLIACFSRYFAQERQALRQADEQGVVDADISVTPKNSPSM